MTFLYPLGLLGLIGIPILIIIYIIKNKYTEQTVASTYLWTLSERFLKRRNPINKIAGIISLILQILAVLFLSFGIAHPVFTVYGMANRYCFILDCSGSMRTEYNSEESRFDEAKNRIATIVNEAVDGSVYTLICVGDSTTVYEETSDKDRVLSMLDQTQPAYSDISFNTAATRAQEIFDNDSSTLTYLVTDKNYETLTNINLINVASAEENYALYDVTYDDAENLVVNGKVQSYTSDAALDIVLTVNSGEEQSTYTTTVNAVANTEQNFTFETEMTTFDSFVVEIVQSDAQPLDNKVISYNVNYENSYSTLLVGDETFFLRNMLNSTGNAAVTTMTTEEYTERYLVENMAPAAPSGYRLYIFQEFNPQVLPTDGTVWLFGVEGNLPDACYSYQNKVDDASGYLTFANKTSTLLNTLLANIIPSSADPTGNLGIDIYINSYYRCSPYREYTTLATYGGVPVIFTTQTASGNREVVFAFTFGDSDAAIGLNFLILFNNLIDYSFPEMLDQTLFTSGETATLNVLPNTESIRVESPSSKISYLDTSSSQVELALDEVGTYIITAEMAGNNLQFRIYSALPASESRITVSETDPPFVLAGEQTNEGYDGRYDGLIILFALVAVVFLADWVVYCYEQYQLR